MKTIKMHGFKFDKSKFDELEGLRTRDDHCGVVAIPRTVKIKDEEFKTVEVTAYKHVSYVIDEKKEFIYFSDEAGYKYLDWLGTEVFEPANKINRKYDNYRDRNIKSVKVSIKMPDIETLQHEAIDFLNSIGAKSFSKNFMIKEVDASGLADEMDMFIDYIESMGFGEWSMTYKDKDKIAHKIKSTEWIGYFEIRLRNDYQLLDLVDEVLENI